MKTLLICRHAKTHVSDPRGDWHRTLKKRGERDAGAVADHLAQRALLPARIIASNAARARSTAEIIAAALSGDREVELEPRIYEADVETLLDLVGELPGDDAVVLLVGHNPGMEQLASLLAADRTRLGHLPTAALVQLDCDVDEWPLIRPHSGRLVEIFVPAHDS